MIIALDRTAEDVTNPGTKLWTIDLRSKATARYVRVTATKLAPRMNDFICALAELSVFDVDGKNVALGTTVTALDSIEAPVRWAKKNLVDGVFTGQSADDVKQLREQRAALLERLVPPARRDEMRRVEAALVTTDGQLKLLPAPQYVYAGMIHHGGGTFSGTGPLGGKPRPIHILKRGDVTTPGDEVGPGIVALRQDERSEFTLAPNHAEGDRRVAFAKWIVDEQHPLTWRSIVNRLWQHHLGRGLVDTPNDFGRMGQLPTHPELLDWLAIEFRDGGRSLKRLHRQIVTSSVYRQRSLSNARADQVDSSNTLLWRSNRRKLDAESLRDAMLLVAGKLDDRMGGPAFQDFVIEKPEHSPHYEYHLHDPEDPKSHRRSIYRFLVRSQTQPFMATLDCADPSMIVEKRNETVTALQALALRNNKLVLSMSAHMARRIETDAERPSLSVRAGDVSPQVLPSPNVPPRNEQPRTGELTSPARTGEEKAGLTPNTAKLGQRIALAFRLALGRSPTEEEQAALAEYATQHGLSQTCRVILNLNEFAFVD